MSTRGDFGGETGCRKNKQEGQKTSHTCDGTPVVPHVLYWRHTRMRRWVILLGFCVAAAGADAERGAQVLQRETCFPCRAFRGGGANLAPDLSRRTAHGYPPATLASMMWNPAPA